MLNCPGSKYGNFSKIFRRRIYIYCCIRKKHRTFFFAPVENITLVKESGAPSAVIDMEMSRPAADALAKRIHGRVYKGRDLRAWVPLRDW